MKLMQGLRLLIFHLLIATLYQIALGIIFNSGSHPVQVSFWFWVLLALHFIITIGWCLALKIKNEGSNLSKMILYNIISFALIIIIVLLLPSPVYSWFWKD
ncbi:MAG: hypothetical protein ACTHLE_03235 [Agriterribacter sp.]